MGIQNFNAIFNNIDTACKGFITTDQLHDYYISMAYDPITFDQVEASVLHVCGYQAGGRISRDSFLAVLEEVSRRQSVEQQAYWDFQAFDYGATNRISLPDTLLLFREFHGDRFSMKTWYDFIESRDEPPGANVYFDEIRMWLCCYPSGDPASEETITKEEERLYRQQEQHDLNNMEALKKMMNNTEDMENHRDSTNYNAKRKLNKWKREGLKAMLNDDGLEADDVMDEAQPKDYVNRNDLIEALEVKYDMLREKLLYEMAALSSAIDGDQPEIFQQLCSQERQLRREGHLEEQVNTLPGSKVALNATLTGLMGEVRIENDKQKMKMNEMRKSLKSQGMSDKEIDMTIQTEYQKVIEGDTTCGATLIHLHKRYKEEKDGIFTWLRSHAGNSFVTMEYNRLSRQHLLLGEEGKFVGAAIAVGLAERPQQYQTSSESDWDRSRAERLAQLRLTAKKGHKQLRSGREVLDLEEASNSGVIGTQREIITEIVKKHLYEREALINMLQGRDSAVQKTSAKRLSMEQRKKRLKTLRNQHKSWQDNKNSDPAVLGKILQEAVGLCYENRLEQMRQENNKLSEGDVNECILADLEQQQEVEVENKLTDMQARSDSSEALVNLLAKENKARVHEHFENVAFVILGQVEVREGDKDYLSALERKYNAIREKVFSMALRDQYGSEWKRLADDKKKDELRQKKKEEKRLRGEGMYEEMESLIGHKSKTLPSLRKMIGEDKPEFEARFTRQKTTGQIEDEVPAERFIPTNHLADLIPRYDGEEESMLSWLHAEETNKIPKKIQRLRILRLKLEEFLVKMENKFEVASLSLGLFERIEASLHGRHSSDIERQKQLATRRVQIRQQCLLNHEEPKKPKSTSGKPNAGDMTGWQVALVSEVMLRHSEEREQLLKILQDEGLEDLTEAVTHDLSDEDRKTRLAELHSKRRQLNLENPDDKEDHISILEEAVAIRVVLKKSDMEQSSRKSVSTEEVSVGLLTDLQEEQDRELAKLLGMMGRLEEADLRKQHENEEKQRQKESCGNLFVILTQSEGKAHENDLVKALEAKYNQLQECILLECLVQRSGKSNWDKMSDREKQQKQITLRQEVNSYRATGNTVGLWEALGNISSRETILSLMGMLRNEFTVAVNSLDDTDAGLVIEKDSKEEKCNPLIDIWQRFEDEKSDLLQALKGLQVEYMEEKDQELHLVRLHREYLLGCRDDSFSFAAILVGLAERQTPNGKPRLSGDRDRYTRLAKLQMNVLSLSQKKPPEQKDEINKSNKKVSQMDNVVQMLERKHRDEHGLFHCLLMENANQEILDEVIVLSQQQRKERLAQLLAKRQETPLDQQKEHWRLFMEGIVVKRELCRERLTGDQKEEASDEVIHQTLFSDLLSRQNGESEEYFQQMAEMTYEDLNELQAAVMQSRKVNAAENVALVVFSPESADDSSDTDLLEALDGKFDALRDKLLAEALMKQLGEAEWKLLSEKERQKKLMELKLKERQLRRDGKFDELARLLGDAFEDQELLKKLMGESKEDQEKKLRERLEKRRQRKAQGMSEEECDRLEQQDIEKEEAEERKRRRNILGDLQHAYEHEKDELLRRLREGEDKYAQERERQLQLMKLKRDERRARQEDKFDSAALVIGMAKEREEKMKEDLEEERKRQMRLAKERLEAARRRKAAGQTEEDTEPEINIDTEDKIVLREAVTIAVDKRHQKERQLLIQILDESSDSPLREKIRNMSEEQRKDKLAELKELRKLWRDGDLKDQEEQLEIFREAACIELESLLEKMRSEGHDLTEDEVKVHILSDLQQQQDSESRLLLADIQNKDPKTLQQIVQVQRMLQEKGWNDNIAFVLLGKSQKEADDQTEADEDPDKQLVDALEQKYDALREKLLEAALIKEIGEDNWNKMSDKDKQKKLVEVKLRERKLREDGNLSEANQLYGNLSEDNEILDALLVEDDRDEEQKMKDMMERKEELRKEREEQGLSTDDDTLNQIVEEEEEEKKKQRRRNVLENLQTMFEDEKDALMRSLRNQQDRIAQERERQLAVAKLRRDKNRMKQEEKLDSVALIFSMAHEAEEKQKQNIEADRQRMRALAKERLEARKKRKLDKKDKENLEDRLKADDEAAGIQELTQDAKDQNDGSATQGAILDFMDKRQSEERDLLMELFTAAKNDTRACQQASKMSPEDLKMDLSKLEKERTKWREKSQQVALGFDESVVNKAVWDKYYKQVADSRREQTRILTQAMVQRLELEERNLKANRPDMSDAEVKEELSVSLLADLQEKQATEVRAIQDLMQKQDTNGLQRLKRLQRTSRREGWYDSLTATLFQMSGVDGDDAALATFEKMKAEMEQELEKEKEAFIENAKKKGSDIDIDAALKELERQQEAKRKAMNASLNQQQKSLRDRIAARKLQAMNKEGEEIAAAQIILLAQDQEKAEVERIKSAKGKQSTLLQQRLEARRLERKRKAEEAKEEERPPSTPSSNASSRPPTVDYKVMPPPFRMTREKTVVDVNVTDEEKNAVVSKLVREQTSLHKKITDTQKQQEEMLQRRLELRKGKRQEEAQQLFEIGERNKSTYQKSKEDEKSRQMELLKQRVQARRDRSRSPNPIAESPNTTVSRDKPKKMK